MSQLETGQKLRCDQCGTEIIVLTVTGTPEVTCCGAALTVIFSRSQT